MDEMITTLGATPVFVDSYGDEVIACDIDAEEVGFRRAVTLPGAGEDLDAADVPGHRDDTPAVRPAALPQLREGVMCRTNWWQQQERLVHGSPRPAHQLQREAGI